jgi:C-terminal processing protease CtpA/Prc
MDQADIAGVVDRVARLLDEHYVFPEVGTQLGQVLTGESAAGRYAAAADAAALAPLVTADLQSVNGDKHLRLLYSDDEVRDEEDEGAEVEAMIRHAAVTAGGIARVERLRGNIGYLDLRPILFPPAVAGHAATAAMNLLAATDALIIDLRQCLGGDPDMVALLCSYLFDGEPVHLNDLVERGGGRTRQFWTLPYVPGPRFGAIKPLYVLTSGTSFSGAEELSYNVQQRRRGTIVGEQTRGGAHPREGFRVHPHLLATIPVARAVNPVSGTNWEGTGVAPDVAVPAARAFPTAYRLALERVRGTDPRLAAEVREALAELD